MDKKIIVVDTSVVVKWFVDEPDSRGARKILEDLNARKIKIVCPKIILLETINALRFGGAKLEKNELHNVFKLLNSLENIEFVEIDDDLLFQVIDVCSDFKIATYDSVFIALAKQKNCALLTCDKKHHRKEIYEKIEYL